jgi:hypothetical protein
MAGSNVIGIVVVASLLIGACENAEKKARYVKAPLESIDAADRTSLNSAVSEARTRLASVRNEKLRADLSRQIDDAQERVLEQIRAAELEEAMARQAAREAQAERERAAAALEDARRRDAERKYETERKRDEERKAEPVTEATDPGHEPWERRRAAAVERQNERTKEGVTELEVGMRSSALNDGTMVLILRNAKPYPVSFELRCFTRDDTAQKTFAMRIAAGGEKRIGFMQGWCGNFKGGERCEAYVDGELMWSYTVPE